jgi:quinone-modifying oxidoreductase, subunit QmoB
MEHVGVFLCSGCGIGDALDLEAVASAAEDSGGALCHTHPCLCAEEGIALVRESLSSGEADGLVIAACSQRVKCKAFSFDSATPVQRVGLREQVTWSHPPNDEDTQMLAEDLVRMGVARVLKSKPPVRQEEEIADTVLVVGGGLTGLEAAAAAAGLGKPVVLLEKEAELGGHLAGIGELAPAGPPYDQLHENPVSNLIEQVRSNSRIRVLTSAVLRGISGQPGQFKVEVAAGGGDETFMAGAIVQATGARPYDAHRLAHLGYGEQADVITSAELDAMLEAGSLTRPSNGETPQRVAFVQCAGSRDAEHLLYCSGECCATTLRQAARLRRDYPDVEPCVVYRDIRMPGQQERFYLAVQEEGGTLLMRGEVDGVGGNGNGRLAVHLRESLLGDDARLEADLVVLAVGMVPNSADGEAIRALHDAQQRVEHGESETQREEARKVAERLAAHEGTEILHLGYRQGPDLPVLQYGFPDSHYICFPYETRRTGIYSAGALRAPMDPAQAVEDAWGAALKAVQCIEAARRGEAVHPRSGDLGAPDFFLQRCTQCKRCTEECPFGTLNEDEKGTPQLNVLRCRRCGICMGACPERIISFPDYSVDAVASMIKAIEVPEEEDEKPRIVALMCENDALPALDAAARLGRTWSPWIRIVPVRCLGSVNIVWIADSLSRGVDGVILVGCKYGDDAQCHYIRGSELASKRLENVQETLDRLALEPERIKLVELAHNEFDRVPTILDEFAAEIEEMDPNPYKGF